MGSLVHAHREPLRKLLRARAGLAWFSLGVSGVTSAFLATAWAVPPLAERYTPDARVYLLTCMVAGLIGSVLVFAFEPLTRREREVLALIAKSYDNHQIADFLNVTGQTAKNYVHNLYGKLGANGRLQLLQLLQQPRIRLKLGLDDE